MKSILHQLYEGEIYPNETVVPHSPEYQDVREGFRRSSQYLSQKLKDLTPEFETRLSDTLDEFSSMCAIEREEMFRYGFSLGMKLLAEALFLDDSGEAQ